MRNRIFRNLNWNWAGLIADMGVAFLLCPYLVENLGSNRYGAWVMIGSLTGYFGLLDLGIRGSVGRFVAYYRSLNDDRAVAQVVSSALAILIPAGLIAMVGTLTAFALSGERLSVDFSTTEWSDLQVAMILSAIQIAIWLPFNAYEGFLWGCERFDALNRIRIPADLIRGALTAAVVYCGLGVTGVACVTLAVTVTAGFAKRRSASRISSTSRFQWSQVRFARIRELLGFGIWGSVRSVAMMIPARLTPLLAGILLGVGAVTPLSLATRLIASASGLLVAVTGVMTPLATSLHARGDRDAQHRMMMDGGRICFAAACAVLALFAFLGRQLITLWVGPEFDSAFQILLILALGRTLGMSQTVTRSMLTAAAKVRGLSTASIIQAVVSIVLIALLTPRWGLLGIAASVAIADALCEGVFSLIYGCRTLQISVISYVASILTTAVAGLALPTFLLISILRYVSVDDWFTLSALGAGYALTSACLTVAMVIGPQSMLQAWKRRAVECAT